MNSKKPRTLAAFFWLQFDLLPIASLSANYHEQTYYHLSRS